MQKEFQAILESLKAEKLPPSLSQLVENELRTKTGSYGINDVLNPVIDLFNVSQEVQGRFFEFYHHVGSFMDSILIRVKAYKELSSPDRVKQFILEELVENRDPYDLIDMRACVPGEAFHGLYWDLTKAVQLRPNSPEEIKHLLQCLEAWETAAIDII